MQLSTQVRHFVGTSESLEGIHKDGISLYFPTADVVQHPLEVIALPHIAARDCLVGVRLEDFPGMAKTSYGGFDGFSLLLGTARVLLV
jgi:hypothetical protein